MFKKAAFGVISMKEQRNTKPPLFFYDAIILFLVEFIFVGLYRGIEALPLISILEQI